MHSWDKKEGTSELPPCLAGAAYGGGEALAARGGHAPAEARRQHLRSRLRSRLCVWAPCLLG